MKKIFSQFWMAFIETNKAIFSEDEVQSPTLQVRPEKWSSSLIL